MCTMMIADNGGTLSGELWAADYYEVSSPHQKWQMQRFILHFFLFFSKLHYIKIETRAKENL